MFAQTIHSTPSPRPFPILSPVADCVATLIAQEKSIAKPLLFNRSRCRLDTARARQLAMYLMHVVMGQSLTAVGEAFGRDRTTVSYACALIEDMRDDARFDAEVSRLEAVLEAVRDKADA